jgi:hypothetical protein
MDLPEMRYGSTDGHVGKAKRARAPGKAAVILLIYFAAAIRIEFKENGPRLEWFRANHPVFPGPFVSPKSQNHGRGPLHTYAGPFPPCHFQPKIRIGSRKRPASRGVQGTKATPTLFPGLFSDHETTRPWARAAPFSSTGENKPLGMLTPRQANR